MALFAGIGVSVSSAAFAHVDVGVSIGVPGVAYAPEPVYAPPAPVYVQPPSAVVINPGRYGDRYYDGHRYWERREGWSAITMNGSGTMLGPITMDIAVTGAMTATAVAREVTGTVTKETATRGATIDTSSVR
jgi:hypothetical protein